MEPILSPILVLRRLAEQLGCGYQDIESFLTSHGFPTKPDNGQPEHRLRAIRLAIGTGEAESVLEQAAAVAKQIKASP